MRVSFLVPAYNEAGTVVALLDAVWALDLDKQIVVVDDGSTDGTRELVEQWQERREGVVLVHQANRGKGAAVCAAIPHADGDIAVIQDADLEYDPALAVYGGVSALLAWLGLSWIYVVSHYEYSSYLSSTQERVVASVVLGAAALTLAGEAWASARGRDRPRGGDARTP